MDVKGTKTPYDALIDIFEPKMTTVEITKVFNELQQGLTALIQKCENADRKHEGSISDAKCH
jgi:Zn-dependent M32 family carboxypeptidase